MARDELEIPLVGFSGTHRKGHTICPLDAKTFPFVRSLLTPADPWEEVSESTVAQSCPVLLGRFAGMVIRRVIELLPHGWCSPYEYLSLTGSGCLSWEARIFRKDNSVSVKVYSFEEAVIQCWMVGSSSCEYNKNMVSPLTKCWKFQSEFHVEEEVRSQILMLLSLAQYCCWLLFRKPLYALWAPWLTTHALAAFPKRTKVTLEE